MRQISTTLEKAVSSAEEGLVVDCEGPDGLADILELMTEAEAIQSPGAFSSALFFEKGGARKVLLPFDGADPSKVRLGRLAAWRLAARPALGAMWLSDFVGHMKGEEK